MADTQRRLETCPCVPGQNTFQLGVDFPLDHPRSAVLCRYVHSATETLRFPANRLPRPLGGSSEPGELAKLVALGSLRLVRALTVICGSAAPPVGTTAGPRGGLAVALLWPLCGLADSREAHSGREWLLRGGL